VSPDTPAIRTASAIIDNQKVPFFGYNEPRQDDQAVIYTVIAIHSDNTDDDEPTMFTYHPFYGISSIGPAVGNLTIDIVHALSYCSVSPYDGERRLRIAASDNPDYASMISFQKQPTALIEDILWQIAQVLYQDPAVTIHKYIESVRR
jgi:hypothetical protein